ncbi:MAG TPA: leucine-rich repeat domain-containing protein [Candidatus Lokiarchaeia archaeon]|nr:leucine-rich repeat domain-containing protein [Candidatus Lokiarchaeia archaeon]
MQIRLENLEKKIIASERNQPRIYLSKQETQRFDLARPVFVTIEQEDYPIVDAEVIEFFNEKLGTWFQQQTEVQPGPLENFLYQTMAHHQFQEVSRSEENIAFARAGKYLNIRYPAPRDEFNFPVCGFDGQIEWLTTDVFKFNVVPDLSEFLNSIDFDGIMKDLFAAGTVYGGLVANKTGQILYASSNCALTPEEVKKCLSHWERGPGRRGLKIQGVKYAQVFSRPEYFSAKNIDDNTWLVGAASPAELEERYYVLAFTASGVDGKQAYMDVARTAGQMKSTEAYTPQTDSSGKVAPLVKGDYDTIIALETQLGQIIPEVAKIDYNTFGFIINERQVVALGLSGKSLKSLPENLGNLTALQTLNLSCNQLAALPESMGNLKSLRFLDLASNQLANLPESFGNLTELQTIYLNDNKLATFPESFGNLQKLQTLWIQNNKLTSIPDSFRNLSALQTLNLNVNKLSALPESFGNLNALENLDLGSNKLASLPESICQLSALKQLNVAENPLTALPESIGELKELQTLNAMDAKLTTLPETIGQLAALKQLFVGRNQFNSLPDSLGELSALEELNLDTGAPNLPLPPIPETIVNLSALKVLGFGLANVTAFPEETKKVLRTLQNQGCEGFAFLTMK